jgi:hypothetical protein
LGIVVMAALADRVSMQIAGKPAARSASCSQVVSGHASRPTRSRGRPSPVRAAMKAEGSLAARNSLIVRLVDETDRGLFQGDVESGKGRHGCSFLMLWRSTLDHDLASR